MFQEVNLLLVQMVGAVLGALVAEALVVVSTVFCASLVMDVPEAMVDEAAMADVVDLAVSEVEAHSLSGGMAQQVL